MVGTDAARRHARVCARSRVTGLAGLTATAAALVLVLGTSDSATSAPGRPQAQDRLSFANQDARAALATARDRHGWAFRSHPSGLRLRSGERVLRFLDDRSAVVDV